MIRHKSRPHGPVAGTRVPTRTVTSIVTSVLLATRLGFFVLACASREKKPAWHGGYRSATNDPARVKRHWKDHPDHNYGIATGAKSGIFVLDIDGGDGRSSLTELEQTHGKLPKTVKVLTSKGFHLYFAHPGRPVGNSAGAIGTGVDVRGDGGYVIGAGSTHESGRAYRYAPGLDPDSVKVAEAPAWLIERVVRQNGEDSRAKPAPIPDQMRERAECYATAALDREGRRLASAPKHQRNDTLNRCAFSLGQLVGASVLDEGTVKARLRHSAAHIGLEAQEIEGTLTSGLEAGKSRPRNILAIFNGKPTALTVLTDPKADQITAELAQLGCTDTDNGIRLATRCRHQLAYCPQRGWLVWDGRRWKEDSTKQRILLAQEAAKRIADEAASQPTDDARSQRTRFATMSLSKGSLERMLDMAAPMMVVEAGQLDADPMLFNVENGTIDLRTGKLDPHDPRDMLTKMAPVTFDPEAKAPAFIGFMRTILAGDKELYRFLGRAIGYTLTGLTAEQVFFYVRGPRQNGKSTLVNMTRDMLGDYGLHTPTETLLVKQHDNAIPSDLARLDSVRMVTAIEASAGKQLDEGRIKGMTGGDPITARFLRKDFFTFLPQFKLWFAANDDPRVRSTDDALWRRIRVIPLDIVIPENVRDPDLPAKLKAEWPGILAWAVRGCLDWQRIGLAPPSKVTEATGAYRQRADHVKRFISECIIHDEGSETSASAMRRSYEDWCERNHEHPQTEAEFKKRLIDIDFTHKRHATGRVWVHVTLRRR